MIDEVIARLRGYGYLDDAKFAQSYASIRLRERPIGRRRLQRDLWLKKSTSKLPRPPSTKSSNLLPKKN